MNLIISIAKTIMAGVLTVGSLFTGAPHADAPLLGAYNPAAGGTYRLQTSLGSTDTTIRLSSFKDPRNNYPITMTYMNTSIAYGTLDPQTSSNSELVSFTGVTQNSDGTASLTGVTRGLLGVSPFTASTTLRKTHAGQSIFILSDAPQVFNEYTAKRNDETITGSWTFASTTFNGTMTSNGTSTFGKLGTSTVVGPVTFNTFASTTFNATSTFNFGALTNYPCNSNSPLTQMCDKAYINSVATSGAPDASTIQKGVVEEATAAEVAANTATGGTGARLFINPSTLASTTIPGLVASSSVFASSTYTGVATTTMFTITSTSSTQRISVWVKGQSGGTGAQAFYISYTTAAGSTGLDTITMTNEGTTRGVFSMVANYLPTATGTVQFFGSSASLIRAVLEIIR